MSALSSMTHAEIINILTASEQMINNLSSILSTQINNLDSTTKSYATCLNTFHDLIYEIQARSYVFEKLYDMGFDTVDQINECNEAITYISKSTGIKV